MSALADLIPTAKALSRTDKVRLIRLLADELAAADDADDAEAAIPADQAYPVWSPDRAHAAAAVLLQALSSAEGRP